MINLTNLEKSLANKAGETFLLRRIESRRSPRASSSRSWDRPAPASRRSSRILGMLDHDWTRRVPPARATTSTRLKPKERIELNKKHVGFVFQQYHLLDNLTVAENLDIPLSYRNVKGSERAAIVADTLDRFQIVGKKDLFPSQLSGGQQQLVGVARALIAKPKLLLADEPTGNLHSDQGREIMRLFKKLNDEGTTIVQVTHSEENATYGNRIVRLRDGWIVND